MKDTDKKCPKCGNSMNAHFVDVGIGFPGVQVSPYICDVCRHIESGTCLSEKCAEVKCKCWEACRGRAL